MQRSVFGVILLLGLLPGACGGGRAASVESAGRLRASGPAPDTTLVLTRPLARFEDARALAVAPDGTIYVVDAGADAVVRLTPDVGERAVLGGPGTRAGTFAEPADLDPTNGLELYVADAGNGRVQLFSPEFEVLAAWRLGEAAGELVAGEQTGVRPSVGPYSVDAARPRGRPVGIRAAPSGTLFVVDADAQGVFLWRAETEGWEPVGVAGPARLVDPVALGFSSARQRLVVADRGREALQVYDAFGSYVTTWLPGRLPGVRALTLSRDRFWVVLRDRVLVVDQEGRLLRSLRVSAREAVVDVHPVQGALLVLTATALHRLPFAAAVPPAG